MGNGITKVTHCFSDNHHDIAVTISDPLHEGLGHSFCYIRPEPTRLSSSKVYSEEDDMIQTTTFRYISGASVSANTSTASSTCLTDTSSCPYSSVFERSSTFESSSSFSSIALQPLPRSLCQSGPGSSCPGSGPMERGFLSGPIERGLYSGPIEKVNDKLQRSSSHNGYGYVIGDNKVETNNEGLIKTVKRVISSKLSCGHKSIKNSIDLERNYYNNINVNESVTLSGNVSLSYDDDDDYNEDEDDDGFSMESLNLQWAQGKAGEDRVHIMISEKKGWVFVGIYDGFNGPDAPDYLLKNFYFALRKEMKGLLWNDKFESVASTSSLNVTEEADDGCLMSCGGKENCKGKLKDEMKLNCVGGVNHDDVLRALGEALRKTEEAYLEVADKMVMQTPELAMMGSCVLVMLMKEDDVYLMNVGDSRAVLARKGELDIGLGNARQDLDRIKKENMNELLDGNEFENFHHLNSIQLTMDHSTNMEEEVKRIKEEHPDDAKAITKDRVKGSLKVTRAFGAGFLKQPKWNDAVLEAFRIDYVGTSPYLTCSPSLYHHKLSPRDRFLILSSDGLYEYFTNEEAVSEVESFIASNPTEDPAQHLIEEVLFRAAKKAGMDFYELLDIPQGERRRYHDDVSVIIVSLEGRIWRSSVYRDIN